MLVAVLASDGTRDPSPAGTRTPLTHRQASQRQRAASKAAGLAFLWWSLVLVFVPLLVAACWNVWRDPLFPRLGAQAVRIASHSVGYSPRARVGSALKWASEAEDGRTRRD
jgi:hypothetical protein